MATRTIELGRSLLAKGVRALNAAPVQSLLGPDEYPLDWRMRMHDPDEDGAVWVRNHDGGNLYPHPVATAFMVIGNSQILRRASAQKVRDDHLQMVLAGVQALLDMQMEDGSFRYPVAVPRYGLAPGWSSGMAQGLFVSATREAVRCGAVEQSEVQGAVSASIEHMRTPIGSGGCTFYDTAWTSVEECPSSSPSRIFNGAVFAILGLLDSGYSEDWEFAVRLASDLSRHLGQWDSGWWSYYDVLDKTPASPDYHRLHIELLGALDNHFPGYNFGLARTRFISYYQGGANRGRALASLSSRRLIDIGRGRR